MAQQYGENSGFTVQLEGPYSGSGGSSAKIVNVTIPADTWKGAESPYSQVVDVDGITANSKVDLTPSAEQITMFRNRCIAMMAENDSGVVTVYAFGDKPEDDLVISATLTEVVAT